MLLSVHVTYVYVSAINVHTESFKIIISICPSAFVLTVHKHSHNLAKHQSLRISGIPR